MKSERMAQSSRRCRPRLEPRLLEYFPCGGRARPRLLWAFSPMKTPLDDFTGIPSKRGNALEYLQPWPTHLQPSPNR